MRSVTQTLRSVLHRPVGHANPFQALNDTSAAAEHVVRLYYVVSLYLCARLVYAAHEAGNTVENWDLLWPLIWAEGANMAWVTELLALAALGSAFLVIQFQHSVLARGLFAVFFFQVATITNSIGGINHPYHAWIWVGFILVFLPSGRVADMKRAARMGYLTIFVSAQVMFMLFYTMAGLWKVGLGGAALYFGVPGNFSPEALSWTLADRTLQTDTSPLLAEFFIQNPWLAWPGYLAVMFVQMFAIVAAFRPRLHLVWGYALIGFHVGTWLLMEIIFTEHVLLLVLLFVLSPVAPKVFDVRKLLYDLPVLGEVFKRAPERLERAA